MLPPWLVATGVAVRDFGGAPSIRPRCLLKLWSGEDDEIGEESWIVSLEHFLSCWLDDAPGRAATPPRATLVLVHSPLQSTTPRPRRAWPGDSRPPRTLGAESREVEVQSPVALSTLHTLLARSTCRTQTSNSTRAKFLLRNNHNQQQPWLCLATSPPGLASKYPPNTPKFTASTSFKAILERLCITSPWFCRAEHDVASQQLKGALPPKISQESPRNARSRRWSADARRLLV